jgi:hypothetical protein
MNFSNATILMNGSNSLTSNTVNGQTYLAFQVNGSEKARLTTSGLGLFTTSPATSLDVLGDTTIRGNLSVVNTSNSTTLGNITIDGNGEIIVSSVTIVYVNSTVTFYLMPR